MLLMTVDEWVTKYFSEKSRPAEITLRRWCKIWSKTGLAKKVGGTWYIDEHKWLADGDALVEMVLAG